MFEIRRALFIQIGGLIVGAICFWFLSRFFPVAEFLGAAQQRVMQWGVWSAICYPILYAFCNVLLLPGGVLSLGGGFFFGLWWGFLIVLVGNVTGAAISFFISRWIGQHWLAGKLFRNPAMAAFAPAVDREGWKLILLSQLHPLFPTSLLNYLYGLTQIRFRTCMLWVAIGQAPGLFLYTYLGTLGQLGIKLLRGRSHPRMIEYVWWGGGLVTAIVVVILLGQIAARVISEAEDAPAPARAHAANKHQVAT
ncbi:MAG: hypothetical protein QOI04_12 [Verrucomicrobiota bacterium]|jgi:uncharacterized membrane protein YdjX (TVP38/TMEM64 family)